MEAPKNRLVGRLAVLRQVSQALAAAARGSGRAIPHPRRPGGRQESVLTEVALRLASSAKQLAWLQLRPRRSEQSLHLSAALRVLSAAIGIEPNADLSQLAAHVGRLRAFGLDAQTLEAIRGVLGVGTPASPHGRQGSSAMR